MQNKKVLLIHGAGGSQLCWRSFVRDTQYDVRFFNYDCNNPIEDIIHDGVLVANWEEPDYVVGHSLGGVIAWHIADRCRLIKAGASIASPWGGSLWADFVDLVSLGLASPFWRNIGASGSHLMTPRMNACRVPWLNVVGIRSGVFKHVPNDGVLTVESQQAICPENSTTLHMNESHNEIIHSPDLAPIVASFLATCRLLTSRPSLVIG